MHAAGAAQPRTPDQLLVNELAVSCALLIAPTWWREPGHRRHSISVGMPRMPTAGMSRFSSTIRLGDLQLTLVSVGDFVRDRAIILQGPHHSI